MNLSMKNPPSEKRSPREIAILNQAFQSFNEATEQLQNSYDVLNEALETNKNYLHNIMESLPTGVIVVDQNNAINTFNKTAGAITGLDPEACLNKPLSEVFSIDLFEKIVGRTTKEKQKSPIVEREIETPHHGKIYTRISTSPVLDKKNEQIGTVLNIEDITELRRLEEEAQRNRRLRATGEMAAGIAHEIRNPLGSIELFSSLLKKDLKELNIIRLGTSGSIQKDIPVDRILLTERALGFDALLHFYQSDAIRDKAFEQAFVNHTSWNTEKSTPYCVSASKTLFNHFDSEEFFSGVTATNIGFYDNSFDRFLVLILKYTQGPQLIILMIGHLQNKKIESKK